MKKVLLASAALLALGTAAQAAEPVKLSIGGYATEYVGYVGNAQSNGGGANATPFLAHTNYNKVDVQDDININFVGKTTLDNGLTVAVEVDTFGFQGQDSRNGGAECGKTATGSNAAGTCGNSNIKRSYVAISGGFGALIAGEREDATYIVHSSAPDVGIGLQDGAWFRWAVSPTNHRTYSATNDSRYDARTNKITYVTPAFYGLAAAASYVPDINQATSGHSTIGSSSDSATYLTNGQVNGAQFGGNAWGAGLAYANTFGDVSVKADLTTVQANIANLGIYQGGLQVSYAGFTLGGSILNRNVPSGSSATLGTTNFGSQTTKNLGVGAAYSESVTKWAAYAGQSWDLGLSYATGPYSVSVGYFRDQSKNDVSNGTLASSISTYTGTKGVYSGGGHDTTEVWMLSGAYILGPGVTWKTSVGLVDYSTSGAAAVAASEKKANENKAPLAITGIKVDF